MPHIHTQPGHYDHVVTAFIVRTDFTEPKVLLHMHRKLNKLLPIGGHIELHENPWQAITHEVREESGYDISDLAILQPRDRITTLSGAQLHPLPVAVNTHGYKDLGHFHTESSYAFTAGAAPTHELDEGESTDLRWYSRSELEQLNGQEASLFGIEIYKHILEVCMPSWQAVDTEEFN